MKQSKRPAKRPAFQLVALEPRTQRQARRRKAINRNRGKSPARWK